MKFNVHEVNQAASGGSYVCIFEAEAEFNSTGRFSVSVEAVEPSDTDPEFSKLAAQGIQVGAEHVLVPLGKGAEIRVHRLQDQQVHALHSPRVQSVLWQECLSYSSGRERLHTARRLTSV
jgi:hypothetical protein